MDAPLVSLLALLPASRGVQTNVCDAHTASERAMEKSGGKRPENGEFDPRKCGDFLRARHPAKTAAEVAAATGVPARTVEKWLDAQAPSAPSAAAFCRLAAAYGPGFIAACVPGLAWVERAAQLATYEGLEAGISRARGQQAELAAELFGRKP